jgi:hypothetical protein
MSVSELLLFYLFLMLYPFSCACPLRSSGLLAYSAVGCGSERRVALYSYSLAHTAIILLGPEQAVHEHYRRILSMSVGVRGRVVVED